MREDGYNGWTNYETWCAHLWMSSDEGSDEYFRELARDEINRDPDPDDVTHRFADTLDSLHDTLLGELDVDGMFGDLLRAAVSEIDWYEIAEHYIEAVKEEDACTSLT